MSDNERKQCGNCKGWFQIQTGRWVAGWFLTTCPHCQTLLKTQTQWFELRVALHEHQLDAMQALLEQLSESDKVLIGIPTGTGKTNANS